MKAIVHIGTEKTGTSSIQLFLYKNRKKLMKSGYHFLQSAGKTNNWAVPAFFSMDDRFNDLFRDEGIRTKQQIDEFKVKFVSEFESELRSVRKNIHTVIISSEHFHSRIRTKDEMEDVHQFLSKYFDNIKIVGYLREQVDTCASWYSTSMKSGGTLSFDDFFRRCRPGNYYFNYYEMLGNWERHFGYDSLDIALFSQDRFLNGDLLDDFTARIDPALLGSLNKAIEIENESLKPTGQALARAVNILFPVNSEQVEVSSMRNRCKKIISHGLMGKGQQPLLQARKAIFDSFIESNDQVRQKYFPKMEILFPPSVEVTAPNTTFDEKEFEVMADVFTTLKKYGKATILPQEYANVFSTIFSCMNDIVRVVSDENQGDSEVFSCISDISKGVSDANEADSEMIFSQDDVSLLLCAAGSLQGRDPNSAYRLTALANRLFPDFSGIKVKMEEYLERSEQAPKTQYIVTYHGAGSALNRHEVKRKMAEFQGWLAALDVPEGSPLFRVTDTSTIRSDGTVADACQTSRVGFSIFQAKSLDEALSIAKGCPFLDLGGTLEVSEIGQLQAQ